MSASAVSMSKISHEDRFNEICPNKLLDVPKKTQLTGLRNKLKRQPDIALSTNDVGLRSEVTLKDYKDKG